MPSSLALKLLCKFSFPPTDLRLHSGTRSSRGENLFTALGAQELETFRAFATTP